MTKLRGSRGHDASVAQRRNRHVVLLFPHCLKPAAVRWSGTSLSYRSLSYRSVSLGSRAMLYADKAALENRTKLRLLAIRERELALYTKNCFTIGTVSACVDTVP